MSFFFAYSGVDLADKVSRQDEEKLKHFLSGFKKMCHFSVKANFLFVNPE